MGLGKGILALVDGMKGWEIVGEKRITGAAGVL